MAVVLLLVMLLFGVAAMLAAGFSPVQSEIEKEREKVNLKLLQVVYFSMTACFCSELVQIDDTKRCEELLVE